MAGFDGSTQFTNHEAFISGLLTIAAGAIPVYVIYRQIVQTQLLADSAQKGRMIRSRALLSQPLIELSDYAKESISVLRKHYPDNENDHFAKRPHLEIQAPELPLPAIAAIGEAIGNVGDISATRLASILSDLQVQRSRLLGALDTIYKRSISTTTVAVNELDNDVLDSLAIVAKCSACFSYARFRVDAIDIASSDDLEREARILLAGSLSTVDALIARRFPTTQPLP